MNADGPQPSLGVGPLAKRVAGLRGWRRALAAVALGAAAAAAQPPLHLYPALVVAFTGLVWLLEGAGGRRSAFTDGWLFGAGYFVAGLYWVSGALLVDAARFAWLIPFAVLGLSFGFAVFAGAAALLAHLLRPPRAFPGGMSRVCVLAAAWTFMEWMRGWMFTGFPWNLVGAVWVEELPVLQMAAWVGVYGLSLLTVYSAGAFSVLAVGGRYRWQAACSGVGLMAALAVIGAVRLDTAPSGQTEGVRLRIVQPNISQRDKIRSDLQFDAFSKLAIMSEGGEGVTHVIWPEAATPMPMLRNPSNLSLIRRAVPMDGVLVTGTVRFRRDARGRVNGAWNSVVGIDGEGRVVGVYDKHHLVPFGEYMPLRSILPVSRVVPGLLDFSAGPGPRTLTLPGLPPFSPLICYEVIFPGAVVADGPRPAWLLNVTNDGWFGMSSGPYQHFASARMRAVEEGLPLVRAANTGISGVVDPYGRVLHRLGLGERGVVDSALPLPTSTMYSRTGDIPTAAAVLLIFAVCLAMSRKPKTER